MGVSIPEITGVIKDWGWQENAHPRVLDIGTQNVYRCTADDIVNFINRFDASWLPEDLAAYAKIIETGAAMLDGNGINGAWLGDILVRAGFDYVAYDIFEGFRTKIVDLNTSSVPPEHFAAFDIVLNCGTSEHILNQYNVFEAMHDATRIGGVMYHAIPMTGYLNHGYFLYTPKLFHELAQANEYEMIRIDLLGPGGCRPITEELAHGRPNGSQQGAITTRWQGAAVPDGIVAVTLRRTSGAPFRAALEASTTAAAVAGSVLSRYQSRDGGPANSADHELEVKKAAIRRGIDAAFKGIVEPGFDYREIVRLAEAHAEAYGVSEPFPPALEEFALNAAIAEYPSRDDLRARLTDVEKLLERQWPLYRWRKHAAPMDAVTTAMDGVEAAILSLGVPKERFERAVTAFCCYFAAGQPERFPVALEYEALRYAAENLDASYATLLPLGAAAGKLSTGMRLRRRSDGPQVA